MTVETKRNPTNQTAPTPRELGICFTCNTVDTCTGRATWSGPVHHCEEFDDSDHGSRQPKLKAVPQQFAMGDGSAVAIARRGLCVNCSSRVSCAFPVVDGGVWHCEEYE